MALLVHKQNNKLQDAQAEKLTSLGTYGFSKTGYFLEKFQTTFDPPTPPPHFLKFHCVFFCKNLLICSNLRKFAMKFFGLEMTPSPPFWTFFPKFTTKIYRFETKKICNVIFWIGNDPPPLRKFSKKTSTFEIPYVPKRSCTAYMQMAFLNAVCVSLCVLR